MTSAAPEPLLPCPCCGSLSVDEPGLDGGFERYGAGGVDGAGGSKTTIVLVQDHNGSGPRPQWTRWVDRNGRGGGTKTVVSRHHNGCGGGTTTRWWHQNVVSRHHDGRGGGTKTVVSRHHDGRGGGTKTVEVGAPKRTCQGTTTDVGVRGKRCCSIRRGHRHPPIELLQKRPSRSQAAKPAK
jgi:hypothetical protein